jgi:hypothetical protein
MAWIKRQLKVLKERAQRSLGREDTSWQTQGQPKQQSESRKVWDAKHEKQAHYNQLVLSEEIRNPQKVALPPVALT